MRLLVRILMRSGLPRARNCQFQPWEMTAYSLRVPPLLLHGRCQFRPLKTTNVSISVFNGLREDRPHFRRLAHNSDAANSSEGWKFYTVRLRFGGRNIKRREEGKVAESSPACCDDKS